MLGQNHKRDGVVFDPSSGSTPGLPERIDVPYEQI